LHPASVEFLDVAALVGFSGYNDLGVLLYLQDLYDNQIPYSLRYQVNGTPQYSRFSAATALAATYNHSYTANGVTVEALGIPWQVRLQVNPYSAGLYYNNSVAAVGSRSVIAVLSFTLTEYTIADGYLFNGVSLLAGGGITGLTTLPSTWFGGPTRWLRSIPVAQFPFDWHNTVGFFTVNVTIKGLAKYKDIAVLDGEYWGYAPITGATQAGETITFRTNHTGVFTICGVKSSDNPQTADNSNVALYSMLALVSLAGIAIVNRKRAFNN
jgi:hypothetical protein